MIGIGAAIHYLSGGNKNPPEKYIGKTIASAAMTDDRLQIGFEDGTAISILDNGQSCCESRYMRTDDDPNSLVGHKLTRIEARDGANEPDEYGDHEVCFVEVGTDAGFITIANHNEHNGYYGGFGLEIREEAE